MVIFITHYLLYSKYLILQFLYTTLYLKIRKTELYEEIICITKEDIHCIDGRCTPYPHRADYVCELDAMQAEHFSKEKVLCRTDHWNPQMFSLYSF